jgi:EAL domain-containing protein (putative c-di-GMP-specific phosphodiesterase class I)
MSCNRCEKLPVEEYQYLLTKNVDLMQGYLFGKPEEVPVTKIRLL